MLVFAILVKQLGDIQNLNSTSISEKSQTGGD